MYKIEKVKIGKSLIHGKKTTMDIIENSFLPLLKNLVENNCKIDFESINNQLLRLTLFSFPNLHKKNTYICFPNLTELYQNKIFPRNIFWITYVNTGPNVNSIPPGIFRGNLQLIIEQILNIGFVQCYQLTFEINNNIGMFFYFEKEEYGVKEFTGFYIIISEHHGLFNNDDFFNQYNVTL